jgi:alkanesulfonate monooxygenase SsuD/methylene tetrahydromethanopterin reductase-like flavin-dependent oxidoreductase (luciferase family)
MKVFVDLSRFAATAGRAALRDMVARLEDAGATGVGVSDHLFYTGDGLPRSVGAEPGCDPTTTLAAVAGLSDRLEVQTVVMNSAWIHPALLLRQFAQLAVLIGGERVTAGLGAGWSTEEFAALGMELPRFAARMDRLEEVLRLARELYDRGTASQAGTHVVARDLPLSPVPERPPRLLVGGGSDRVLRMAGRYADVLDLHGDPRHGKVAGATMAQARAGDVRRRALTTVEDLATRIALVRAAAQEAGRPPDAVSVSTQIWYVAYGAPADVRAAEEELCATWAGIPYRPLDRSPYLLFGSPAGMAEALLERRAAYGLERISLSAEGGIDRAPADPLRFCREVLPLLDRQGALR